MGEDMKVNAILLDSRDNVATAIDDLTAGDEIIIGKEADTMGIVIREDIAFGHKFAVVDLEEGSLVIKYGEVIGRATQKIPQGTHAHIHNIESLRGRGDLEACHAKH
jgi:altronate dehydratase small subunit